MLRKREPFFWLTVSCGAIVLLFIVMPILQLLIAPRGDMLREAATDKDVIRAIWLSIETAGIASIISFVFGTPLAYILARGKFRGKHLLESIIDIPIAIPHPVIGIAILSIVGKNHWFGEFLASAGVLMMGTRTGIITVLTFVGIPFYVKAAKEGFEAVSPRLENVSRSLGASMSSTFFRITFPLAWRSMLMGILMCAARAISEFGAVVIVAYHPMIAPVMIYERFEAYGLKYSQPVAFWLVLICLILFLMLRIVTLKRDRTYDFH